MSDKKKELLKRLQQLIPEELETVSDGADPFANVWPFYYWIYKDGVKINS